MQTLIGYNTQSFEISRGVNLYLITIYLIQGLTLGILAFCLTIQIQNNIH